MLREIGMRDDIAKSYPIPALLCLLLKRKRRQFGTYSLSG
jgi:hypothetical protein